MTREEMKEQMKEMHAMSKALEEWLKSQDISADAPFLLAYTAGIVAGKLSADQPLKIVFAIPLLEEIMTRGATEQLIKNRSSRT